MFHPVGSKSSSVYWRRRLLLIGAVVAVALLAILTATTFAGGDKGSVAGGSPSTHPVTSTASTHTSAAPSTRDASTPVVSSAGTSAAAPTTCKPSALKVAAVVGQKSYKVGDSPTVELQVTNAGPHPCIQDLADSQIELRVYNGSSRVWGSHDCAIQPGTKKRTLAVGRSYLSAVLWGGLSSQPGCKGQRQRIGAGTYTLYALLSGKLGTPTTFTVS